MTKSIYRFFAVAPPGLEALVAWELAQLGVRSQAQAGGVSFRGDLRVLYMANLWLRVASRVLLRVAEFRVLHLNELVERVSRYPWEIYIPKGSKLKIRVTCIRSRLYHRGAVEERIRKGIERRLRYPLKQEGPFEALVVARIYRDQCVLSVDSSGADLFKRGYKQGKGPAPLRENLAAALLLASGWDRRSPILDPFCGTGTVAIEAAFILMHRAPGLGRTFAFEKWRNFVPEWWEEIKGKARDLCCFPKGPLVWASDKSPEAVEATRLNIKAAGVEDLVQVDLKEMAGLTPPYSGSGWLITNPPYGRRLRAAKDVRNLYATLGQVFKRRFEGWRLALLSPFAETPGMVGLPLKEVTRFPHGGLKVRVFSSAPGEMATLF